MNTIVKRNDGWKGSKKAAQVDRIDQQAKKSLIECLKKRDHDRFQELVDGGLISAHQPMAVGATAACFTLGYTNFQFHAKRGTAWAFWPLWDAAGFNKGQLDWYLYVAAKGYDGMQHKDGADEHLRIVKHLAFVGASPDRSYASGSYLFTARGWAGGNLQSHHPGLLEAIEAGEAARDAMFREGLMHTRGRTRLPEGNLPRIYSRYV
ncbi:hypothetical protein [Stenotrophomonas pigmentata]|uniref:hypothetical protein n=1 Tax=Stenotrophomonas pigmentata TaxID=3055080 RepID=UPI0026ED056E|nr:hypothetical protein [Stenotrophomonas sp. 610A2]